MRGTTEMSRRDRPRLTFPRPVAPDPAAAPQRERVAGDEALADAPPNWLAALMQLASPALPTGASALARAAYHLGNRHVPLQIAGDRLVIGYDPVLVDMLIGLGVRTQRTWAPFEPEAGAYAAHH